MYFKMLCTYTTLYTLCLSILISSLASSSPLSFLITFIYSRIISFACIFRTLRCHNPKERISHFICIYIHVLSTSHIFSECYDVIILTNASSLSNQSQFMPLPLDTGQFPNKILETIRSCRKSKTGLANENRSRDCLTLITLSVNNVHYAGDRKRMVTSGRQGTER